MAYEEGPLQLADVGETAPRAMFNANMFCRRCAARIAVRAKLLGSRLFDVHYRVARRRNRWGTSVGEVGAKRGRYIKPLTQPAERGLGEGTPKVFHVLEETEQALAALEAMVDALEARPAKKTQT